MDNRLYDASEIAAAGLKSDTELYLSVKRELEVHLQETVERVEDAGRNNSDAVDIALEKFGSPAETANTILQVNARRLKFRARLRLFIIALVPLIALAIVLFSIIPHWNLLRLKDNRYSYYRANSKSQKEYEKNIAEAAGVDLAKLTQQQQLLLDSDWKSLSKMFPEDKAYFAYDFQSSMKMNTWHLFRKKDQQCNPPRLRQTPKWLNKAQLIDPNNALYFYGAIWEIIYPGAKYIKYTGKKSYRKYLEINDRSRLMAALPYYLAGLSKPFYRNYRKQITQRRLALNINHDLPASIMWKGYLSSSTIYDRQIFDYLAQALPLWGEELIKAKRFNDAEALLDSWQPLIIQMLHSDNDFFIFIKIIGTLNIFAKKLPPLYRQLGKPQKAVQIAVLLDKLTSSWNRRFKQNSSEKLRLKQELLNYGAVIQQIRWQVMLPNEYSRQELATSRIYEYTQADRLLLLVIETLLGCLMIGYTICWLLVRWRLRNKLQPGLFIPNDKTLFKLIMLGVIAPFISWWLMVLLQPGGRDYSLTCNYLNFLAQGGFLIIGTTLWPIVLMRHAVAVRIKEFGMGGKAHRYELLVVLIILGSFMLIALLPWRLWYNFNDAEVLFNSLFAKAIREYYGVYYWDWQNTIFEWLWLLALPLATLAILFLFVAPIKFLFNWRRSDKLFKQGAIVSSMVVVSSMVLMVTVLLSDGYFAWREASLFQQDKSQIFWRSYNIATKYETARILKLLNSIKYKPVNIKINDNGQLFCDIVRVANYKTIEKALKHGANVNAIDADKHSVLMLACRYRKLKVVKLLLDHGAKIDIYSGSEQYSNYLPDRLNGVNTLMIAAFYSDDPRMIELLLKYGADINSKAKKGWSRHNRDSWRSYKMRPLGFALKRFHTKHDNQAVIDLLRKHGAKNK